ncbi:4Fe-4S dicluster domain-containing protein [Plantactinospora sp. S1510]|uniref:4Fe-4S dicluster domain-containing protein n=1 Tax=Plantactinospora alkalitolerans TaxID=2789879 RepID=A0ABS0GQT4_9ACTN|nr:4Fe-4S dicluster domain-containing protein [Plantactinospora alkalitolerans]MBF9128414.1 4Fe-4S dicluster domain-containing protein [Plantactinospora alkalitolerans]
MVDVNSPGASVNPAEQAGHLDPPPRMGFFTDTSVCIGCKACEVACKEWNLVPESGLDLLGMSYDNTGALTANSWRHVAFIEQPRPVGWQRTPPMVGTPTGPPISPATAEAGAETTVDLGTRPGLPPAPDPAPAGRMADGTQFLGMPGSELPGRGDRDERTDLRWLMMSDVCKHCTHAACLDVCPTGSLFRTEFGTVVVQEDICNGCGYCIPACPYGVIDQRKDDGRAWKCTLCYDRIGAGQTPACAQACPTESIQYGEVDELRERARVRVERLHADGVPEARLYGDDPGDGVGGDGAFFLLLDEPEVYGLPPDPVVTTRDLPRMWRRAGLAALTMAAATVAAFIGRPS